MLPRVCIPMSNVNACGSKIAYVTNTCRQKSYTTPGAYTPRTYDIFGRADEKSITKAKMFRGFIALKCLCWMLNC